MLIYTIPLIFMKSSLIPALRFLAQVSIILLDSELRLVFIIKLKVVVVVVIIEVLVVTVRLRMADSVKRFMLLVLLISDPPLV
jgi:hypothetical protein